MDNELIVVNTATLAPAMDMQQALQTYQAMVDFVKGIMHEKVDFGVIPGTDKPTLYKPGAEKLLRFFGLSVRFEMTKEVEQWEGEEPFFYYRYSASLYRISDGILIAQGEGSCNSHEKKYRYRSGEHVCPECGKSAIIKGKKEYGGGWLCWGKKGGCGSKFDDNAFGPVEQVLNPDIADLVNTLQKMAQKRALIAATLIGCNASEYFTQDIEDFVDGAVTQQSSETPGTQTIQPTTPVPTDGRGPNVKGNALARPWDAETLKKQIAIKVSKSGLKGEATDAQKQKAAIAIGEIFEGTDNPDAYRHTLVGYIFAKAGLSELDKAEISVLIDWLESEHAFNEAWAVMDADARAKGQMDMFAQEQGSAAA